MAKVKSYTFESVKEKALRNKKIRAEYDALEDEFTLAQEIIELRKKNNLTQKELAEKAGTSQPAIARLESGNYHNVSLAFIRRVAKALGAVPEIHIKKHV